MIIKKEKKEEDNLWSLAIHNRINPMRTWEERQQKKISEMMSWKTLFSCSILISQYVQTIRTLAHLYVYSPQSTYDNCTAHNCTSNYKHHDARSKKVHSLRLILYSSSSSYHCTTITTDALCDIKERVKLQFDFGLSWPCTCPVIPKVHKKLPPSY